MKNQQIASIFSDMARMLELKGENLFRVRAYQRAAQNIDGLSQDVATLSQEELTEIPGIGKDLAGKVQEYLSRGKIEKYEELKKDIPLGVLDLLKVPGLGPKKAKQFYDVLKIKSVDELEAAIHAGKLKGFPGIQQKTEENILKGISFLKRGSERRPLGRVLPLAEDIVRRLKETASVNDIEVAGSIRRMKDTVKDIDILVTSDNPRKVMDIFVALPTVRWVLGHGDTKSTIISDDGIQVDLRVVEKESFGAALQYFTGSKQHSIKLREMAVKSGIKINEYGVFKGPEERRIGGEHEADVYKALNLPFIAPELREDIGEIEAAKNGKLPDLVALEDIKGDLHVHTKWSDGSHTLEAVVEAAKKRGYEYIAITDHTKGLGVAHGLDEQRLEQQLKVIDQQNAKHTAFNILKGTEIDIRVDGRLDLPDAAISQLDIIVASVHSGFNQDRDQMTRRMLAAIRNPHVCVIAHPTGRLLGERLPYDVDMEMILREAAKYGVAMEVNAYPLRLDMNDQHVKLAKSIGVPIVISTDMHILSQFAYMHYGVSIARRGWAEEKDVLNTMSAEELIKRFRLKRKQKAKTAV